MQKLVHTSSGSVQLMNPRWCRYSESRILLLESLSGHGKYGEGNFEGGSKGVNDEGY